jgi:predicted cobalt transporter CbtA
MAGVVAGAFLLRAADAVASVIGPLFLPVADVGSRFLMVAPHLVTAIFAASLGIGYLLYSEKKWLHIVALVSLSMGGCILLAGALMPFLVRSAASDAVRSSMVSRAIAQELVIIFFVTLVVTLMRKQNAPNQSLSATR